MRPASLLLALSLVACEGDAAPNPPPDDRAADGGSGGAVAASGSSGSAGAAPDGAAPPSASPAPAAMTLERIEDAGDCAGVVPERVPAAVVVRRDPDGGSCAAATSDGTGAVVIAAVREGGATWQAYGADGAPHTAFQAEPSLVPGPQGWHAIVVTPAPPGGEPGAEHVLFGSDGQPGARTPVTPDPAQQARFRWHLSRDPAGGALVGVRSTNVSGNHWSSVLAHRFDADGEPRWPGGVRVTTDDSALEPMFLAGGVSSQGLALVLAQDSAFLDASWLGAGGEAVAASDAGERSDGVVGPGLSPAIELVPLLDGSLAVRSDGAFRRTYGPRATASGPLPRWLSERTASIVRVTRGGAGYAALPSAGAASPDCTQRIDLLSPSGRLCGRISLREEGGACTTGHLDQGFDGTVVQQSARDACTYRWWPGLLGR